MSFFSVIVPIYKIPDEYLKKCIDSILNQSFKDYEIILVDDESPDNCGEICDEYSKKDSRVKVIHKKNEGVSSARNYGIDIAKGEYIGFVDSDDYIEPKMYEILLDKLTRTNSDVSICGYNIVERDNILPITWIDNILNKEDAIEILLVEKTYEGYMWNKLFKR